MSGAVALSPGDAPAYALYLSNFAMAARESIAPQALSVSWSLAIEEQFYLVWPPLVRLLDRLALLRLCAAIVVIAILWRITLIVAGASPLAVYMLTPSYLDALAIGASLALVARDGRGLASLLPWARAGAALGAVALGAVAVAGSFFELAPLMQSIGYTLYALGSGALLVLAVGAGASPLRSALESRVLRAFGRYSHGIYLLDVPVLLALRGVGLGAMQLPRIGDSILPTQLFYTGVAMGASFLAGWASWHLWESRFLRLKERFPYRASAAGPAHGSTEQARAVTRATLLAASLKRPPR